MKNINKTIYGLLFYGSVTLFVYFLITFCTLISVDGKLFQASLYMIYSMMCLAISIITQIKFLKFDTARPRLIYGVINIIVSLLILVIAIYINKGGLKTDQMQYIAVAIGLYIYSGIQILCGVLEIVGSNKMEKQEQEQDAEQ